MKHNISQINTTFLENYCIYLIGTFIRVTAASHVNYVCSLWKQPGPHIHYAYAVLLQDVETDYLFP